MNSAAPARADPGARSWGRAGPLVLARLVSAVLTVSIPLVLARQLDAADYGTYKQLFLVFQLLTLLLPFGMAQSLYFFLPREPEAARAYLGQALAWLTVIAGVSAAAWLVLAQPVAGRFNNPALADYRWELALLCGGTLVGSPLEIWFTARGRSHLSARSYLAWDGLRALALVLPVWAGLGLRGAMVACAAHGLARAAVAWAAWLRAEGRGFSRARAWAHLRYAAPFGAAMLLGVPQAAAHQVAVSLAVAPEVFAIYAVGVFQVPLVDLFYTPTSELLMVQLGELEREGRREEGAAAFREATARLAWLFLPMVAYLWAVAPLFIRTLFGARYEAAVPIFRVSVLGVALATFPLDGALRARAQTRFLFVSYLGKALVTVPLVWGGVRWFGMVGAIGGWLVAEVMGKASLLWRLPAALSTGDGRCRLRSLIPARALSGAGAAAAASGLLTWSVVRGVPQGLAALAASGLLFAASYAAGLRLQGVRPLALLRGQSAGPMDC